MSSHGNTTFYNGRCVSCSIIRLLRVNGLHCRLAKKALYIHIEKYWVECMTSSVILFAYFTCISPELKQIFANSNSTPNCDHFGRHGEWKKVLATKILVKVG